MSFVPIQSKQDVELFRGQLVVFSCLKTPAGIATIANKIFAIITTREWTEYADNREEKGLQLCFVVKRGQGRDSVLTLSDMRLKDLSLILKNATTEEVREVAEEIRQKRVVVGLLTQELALKMLQRLCFMLVLVCSFLEGASFDRYSIVGDVEFLRQKSNPSETVLSGVISGGRIFHQHQINKFGFLERLYLGAGVLTGEDAFDDSVKANYHEFEGEALFSYCFLSKRFQWSPFVGVGFRRHRLKRENPFEMHQETNYLYVPAGVFGDYFLSKCFDVGGEAKVDFMTYGWWKFVHPIFPAKAQHLKWRPAYQLLLWLNCHFTKHWTAYLASSFKYVPLDYPGKVLFSPESKHLTYFGLRLGVECYY